MCAEKFYWKCHRKLLSDYLVAQGVEVVHIVGPGTVLAHKLTPGVVTTADAEVIYPSAGPWKIQKNFFSLDSEADPG